MTDLLITLCFMLLGYFLGAIPTGYLIAKARGIDIQKMGSGNIGATNVLRSVGLIPAIIVVIMDPIKGLLAVLFPMLLAMDAWTIALSSISVVLGNNFNIFLKFRGGKGVATSIGGYAAIDPWLTLVVTLIGVLTIALGRMVSLGSLVAILSAPLLFLLKDRFSLPYFLLLLGYAVLAFVRHWSNIKKLAAGTERRIGEKSGGEKTTAKSGEKSTD